MAVLVVDINTPIICWIRDRHWPNAISIKTASALGLVFWPQLIRHLAAGISLIRQVLVTQPPSSNCFFNRSGFGANVSRHDEGTWYHKSGDAFTCGIVSRTLTALKRAVWSEPSSNYRFGIWFSLCCRRAGSHCLPLDISCKINDEQTERWSVENRRPESLRFWCDHQQLIINDRQIFWNQCLTWVLKLLRANCIM